MDVGLRMAMPQAAGNKNQTVKMYQRERLAQGASPAVATLVSPITTTEGQGFYVELS